MSSFDWGFCSRDDNVGVRLEVWAAVWRTESTRGVVVWRTAAGRPQEDLWSTAHDMGLTVGRDLQTINGEDIGPQCCCLRAWQRGRGILKERQWPRRKKNDDLGVSFLYIFLFSSFFSLIFFISFLFFSFFFPHFVFFILFFYLSFFFHALIFLLPSL